MITGLHHVTALSSNAQSTYDFYAGILGLRLVKKTINYDAPEVYHLYYGDEIGSPGTILTFFPYPGIPLGRKGKGQLTVTSFSISKDSMDFWMKRLKQFGVSFQEPEERFDERFLYFEDSEGLGLELVATSEDKRLGYAKGPVPPEHAIKGFYGITLAEESYEKTADLLVTILNHELIAAKGNRYRYAAYPAPGNYVDILCCPDTLRGIGGAGTVHHVAFATTNDLTQLEARERLEESGYNVTPVLDRQYFHSIYWREPGGVLFEVATLPPGFMIDESIETLGSSLKLPSWEEKNREWIEKSLPPLKVK